MVALPWSTGHHHHIRTVHLGQRGVGGQGQASDFRAYRSGAIAHEDDVRSGEMGEYLVRADRVEGGEPVEEQDGNLHENLR